MKRWLMSLMFLILAVGVLLASLWRESQMRVYSQVLVQEPTQTQPEVTTEQLAQAQGEYDLPDTTLLPGSLMYPGLMVLDQLHLLTVRDPLRRAHIYRQRGDQRLASAIALMERNQTELAVRTLTKATKYLEQSRVQLRQLDFQDPQVIEANQQLQASLKVQQQVVTASREIVQDSLQSALNESLALNHLLQLEIEQAVTTAQSTQNVN